MPAPFVEDVFFFPLCNFSFFVKNQMFLGMWICVRVFDSIPSIHMSVFRTVLSCFYYYSSVLEPEGRDGNTPGSSFIAQDCFSYPGFFVLPYEEQYCSFEVWEELCWDFNGECIESVDCF